MENLLLSPKLTNSAPNRLKSTSKKVDFYLGVWVSFSRYCSLFGRSIVTHATIIGFERIYIKLSFF